MRYLSLAEVLLLHRLVMEQSRQQALLRDLGALESAAKLLGISQPRVSDLLRGRIGLFSADALIDMLARLGIRVRVVTTARKRVA